MNQHGGGLKISKDSDLSGSEGNAGTTTTSTNKNNAMLESPNSVIDIKYVPDNIAPTTP